MPLPAAAILQPDCPVKPAWAVFDPVWYLKCYGDLLPPGIAVTPCALLAYYLERGCLAGHAPSPLFDEIYYLSANPNIPALVRAGRYASGFDHYCRLGHRSHSGHWLFDDALYASLYDDMSLENLENNRLHGRYDHYLRSGQYEHRLAHLLFDGRFHAGQAIAAGDDPRLIERIGPYTQYLYRLHSEAQELPPSVYFDPAWYRAHHDRARSEIGERKFGSAIQHYLQAPATERFDPVAEFSEDFYRRANPDVRAALDAGHFPSGYKHFLQTGVFEFRQPAPDVDLLYYREANMMVRNDLNTGAARDAFAHLRAIGLRAGWPCAPPPDAGLSEAAAKAGFLRKAQANLAAIARCNLDFSTSGFCRLCVVMVMVETFELTLLALGALRSNFAGEIQLILVDTGACDQTVEIAQLVRGAQIIRLERNIGYPRAANLALQAVTAELVLFLHGDIELGFGAIESAIARLRSAPDIGAVGGKILRSHGMLQEAGCIIWRDGSTSGYMRDAAPSAPEANFVRDVDFCSAVFLLCRSAVVKALGGFDADFSPAGYEDADLCRRMAAGGWRIVYDPAVVIHHLAYGNTGGPAQALMRRGQSVFQRKHAAFLQTRPPNAPRHLAAARATQRGQKHILFIEDTIPLRRLGSGYVRANDILQAITAAGHAVSVFPIDGAAGDFAAMLTELPESVEILYDRELGMLGEFLAQRPGYYDLIWISRTHNLDRTLPVFSASGMDPAAMPFVLDTEAIAAVREAARRSLAGTRDFDFQASLNRELELARLCRQCIAVNPQEAELLRRAGLNSVSVLGTMRRSDPTEPAFSARAGILFVAGMHRPDSPNLDALFWYAREILPVLLREMAAPPVLNVAGYVAPGIDLSEFAGHPHIRLHGPAASLRQHYAQNRLFIAPTRFAAGTPYKLVEAAAFGLPCVATGLLAGQLNWQDGQELLTAPVNDAKRFAAQIARLYRAPRLWARLRKNALARIGGDNGAAAFDATVADILGTAFSQSAAACPRIASGAARQRAAGDPVAV